MRILLREMLLRIDWNDVVGKSELDYIMGQFTIYGARLMNKVENQIWKIYLVN